MVLYKNTKVMVSSPDSNINFFHIVVGVLQGDTLMPNMFIIYVLQLLIDLLKENGYTKKPRSRQYLAETITDVDYANDLLLLANTPAQVKSLLHSLEQAA